MLRDRIRAPLAGAGDLMRGVAQSNYVAFVDVLAMHLATTADTTGDGQADNDRIHDGRLPAAGAERAATQAASAAHQHHGHDEDHDS